MASSDLQRAAVAVSSHADPRRAGRLASAEASSALGRERTSAVVLFTCGSHAVSVEEVAAGAREQLPDATVVVVGGSGVVTPDGEVEGTHAISALALSMKTSVAALPAREELVDLAAAGRRLGEGLRSQRPRPTMLFATPRLLRPAVVDAFRAAAGGPPVFGGGAAADGSLAWAPASEPPREVAAIGMRIDGVSLALGVTAGVVPLGSGQVVEEVDAGFVTRVSGRRPLDVLEEACQRRSGRPMVVVTLAPRGLEAARPGLPMVRGVSGVDPARGAIHIGDDVAPGDRLGFATIDATAAREDIDAMLRHLLRGFAGGTPLAGVYVNCAARGRRLYDAPSVDARTLKNRLGDLPFAGLHASLQLASFDRRACVLGHSGVLAVLYAPS